MYTKDPKEQFHHQEVEEEFSGFADREAQHPFTKILLFDLEAGFWKVILESGVSSIAEERRKDRHNGS